MRFAFVLGALSVMGCVYDYASLNGEHGDASDASPTVDGGLPDSNNDRGGASGGAGTGGPSGTAGGGGTSAGAGGTAAGGRPNGAGCTLDGDCSSSHCIKTAPGDAAGICCDGVPGECTTCTNGYRVPKNDGTIVNCRSCSNGTPIPYSGPADMDGTDAACLQGMQYAEPATGPCSRKTWTITAGPPCGATCLESPPPVNAIDGAFASRYTTGRPQGSLTPETIVVLFPAAISTTGLWMLASAPDDGPASYRVEYSADGTTFVPFSAEIVGTGSRNLTIPFPMVTTVRGLRITQTGTKLVSWWSVSEMNVLGCAPK